ncbi:MAG TPA: DNA gyrase C-terminal beta-propeller domain-containing protein, partial [Spirochaetota bacterium]|nr:DNA gyrase C-terminal beta-propeller domain-containing protein [Spirochaetota bacterium]
SGYIKRIASRSYKQQKRGGVGVRGSAHKNDKDIINMLFTATTHDTVMFFTNRGKAYYLKTHEMPAGSRIARGSHIKMYLNLAAGEEIQSYLVFNTFEEAGAVIIATAQGIIKKTKIKEFINAKKRGIQAVNLKNNDTLIGTTQILGNEDIILATRKGLALRTHESNIRFMGRTAAGVRGISIRPGDEVVGLTKVEPDHNMLVVTENGCGKKLAFSEFSPKGRGGKGQIYLKTNEKSGDIATINTVTDKDNVLIISSAGNIIRLDINNISLLGRPAKGPRLANVSPPDFVVDAAIIRPLHLDS